MKRILIFLFLCCVAYGQVSNPGAATKNYTANQLQIATTASTKTTAAASTTADTYGSWVQLVAVNGITTDFIIVAVEAASTAGSIEQAVMDIGTGAAGSEVVVASVGITFQSNASLMSHFFAIPIPVKVLANTRVAIRAKSSGTAGNSFGVRIYYYQLPL